ncbi:phage infection protein [Pseudomonas sp. Bout1]|uniref:phage infection protein n=1 Tax=Pseudomonas sp. Bout1 TaxID=3048600 RepID=UPI002AB544E7|nr:phage infection protein [Pseudomonas sp. Bout1]MDY7532211.1 phage infection protein [Pseudomonas sp. Bout1]MEB0184242.1 phage infection protein [Pseudomonas sp. Bout1]
MFKLSKASSLIFGLAVIAGLGLSSMASASSHAAVAKAQPSHLLAEGGADRLHERGLAEGGAERLREARMA